MISYWGREAAFTCGVVVGWLQCAACLLLQFFTVEADERRTSQAAWLLGRGARVSAQLEMSPRASPRLEDLPRLNRKPRADSDSVKPGSFLACSLAASPSTSPGFSSASDTSLSSAVLV